MKITLNNHEGGIVQYIDKPTINVYGNNNKEEQQSAACDANYEEVKGEAPMPVEKEAHTSGFATAIVNTADANAVITLLHQLMEGKVKPKDVMMPVRAAMEAGVMRRPTWEEFCNEFGKDRLKAKSSLSDYTNPEKKPYKGDDFEAMKEAFSSL